VDISAQEVSRIAKLARLRLGAEETEQARGQFARILELMDELSSLDTSATPATASVLTGSGVLREDAPRTFPDAERLLALAPEREGDLYKVPKVLP